MSLKVANVILLFVMEINKNIIFIPGIYKFKIISSIIRKEENIFSSGSFSYSVEKNDSMRVFLMNSSTRCGIQRHMFKLENEKQDPSVGEFCFNEENKESEEEHSSGVEIFHCNFCKLLVN